MTAHNDWTRAALEAQRFEGWITFEDLAQELTNVGQNGGAYIVVQAPKSKPDFLDANPGGRFKDCDPTVDHDVLQANWVDGAEVVYVGKADNLRRRLREFMPFGGRAPIGHWGGRLIWQLARASDLLISWRATPGEVPREVEIQLISEFRVAYGKPPFANEPHRLGR